MKITHIITWLSLIVVLVTVITQNTLKTKNERKQMTIKEDKKDITYYNSTILTGY